MIQIDTSILTSPDSDTLYMFASMIRNNSELSYNEKMSYLKQIDICKRIRVYEDVCFELNCKVLTYDDFKFLENDKLIKNHLAIHKLQNINLVLNEGWIPDFNNKKQYKYLPWFIKNRFGSWSVYSVARYDCGGADLGFGLYFKSEKLALFSANTFLDIYLDYLPD